MLEKTEGEIKNGQSRDIGNIGHKTQNENKYNWDNKKDEQCRAHQRHLKVR
jgi:hypothetical protein